MSDDLSLLIEWSRNVESQLRRQREGLLKLREITLGWFLSSMSLMIGFFLSSDILGDSVQNVGFVMILIIFIGFMLSKAYSKYAEPYETLNQKIADRFSTLQWLAVNGQVNRNEFLEMFSHIERDYTDSWNELRARRASRKPPRTIFTPIPDWGKMKEYVMTGRERGIIIDRE